VATPQHGPRLLVAGALSSAGAQVVTVISATVTSVLIARTIGPSGNGTFALVLTMTAVAAQVIGLGLPTGISYMVARRRWPLKRAARESLLAAVALGFLGGGLVLAFYALTRHGALEGVTTTMAVSAACAVPLLMCWSFTSAIALALDRYEAYAACNIVQAIATTVLVAALIGPFDLTGAVIALSASHLAAAIYALYWLRGAVAAGRDQVLDDSGSIRAAISFGVKPWLAEFLQLLNYRIDLFILNAYSNTATVGVYSVAVTVTSLAWILPNGLQTALLPRAASLDSLAAAGSIPKEDSDEVIARAVRHIVALLVPIGLLVLLGLVVVVPLLYGSDFHSTVHLGLLLMPGVLALGIGKVTTAAILGRGHGKAIAWGTSVTVALTVILYFVLIPPLEGSGAAIASSASYILATVLALGILRHVTGLPLRRVLVPQRADTEDYRRMLAALRGLRPRQG
jgi:O-antigen/teichoic acid export membrane protein